MIVRKLTTAQRTAFLRLSFAQDQWTSFLAIHNWMWHAKDKSLRKLYDQEKKSSLKTLRRMVKKGWIVEKTFYDYDVNFLLTPKGYEIMISCMIAQELEDGSS